MWLVTLQLFYEIVDVVACSLRAHKEAKIFLKSHSISYTIRVPLPKYPFEDNHFYFVEWNVQKILIIDWDFIKDLAPLWIYDYSYTTIKGQLNSEWIYDVIVSLKMPTKNFKDFCPRSLIFQG